MNKTVCVLGTETIKQETAIIPTQKPAHLAFLRQRPTVYVNSEPGHSIHCYTRSKLEPSMLDDIPYVLINYTFCQVYFVTLLIG